MEIRVIASGSSGNCYYISDGETEVLLECGISFKRIQKALNYKLTNISGCLLTHEHKDHSLAAKQLINNGIPVYCSLGTIEACELENAKPVSSDYEFCVGSFTVSAFDVHHDAREPLGYTLYSNATGESVGFITDAGVLPFDAFDVDYLIIECNYCNDILLENYRSGNIPDRLVNRIQHTHLALEQLKKADFQGVKVIYLVHLSDSNSDAARMKKEIQELAGCEVYTA